MVSKRIELCSTLSILKEKYLPRYVNESPILTVGTRSRLMISLGRNWKDEVNDLFIPKDEHLSTLIIISAQVHHLENG